MAQKKTFFVQKNKLEKDEFAIKLFSTKDKTTAKINKYNVNMDKSKNVIIDIQLSIPADLVAGDSLPADKTPYVVFKNKNTPTPAQNLLIIQYAVSNDDVILYIDNLMGQGTKTEHGN